MSTERIINDYTYDETLAIEAYRFTKHDFSPELKKLVQWFQECVKNEKD